MLLLYVSCEESWKSTAAALKTLDGDEATWNNICSPLLRQSRFPRLRKGASVSESSLLKPATVQTKDDHSRTGCYDCNKLADIARNCKSEKGQIRPERAENSNSLCVQKWSNRRFPYYSLWCLAAYHERFEPVSLRAVDWTHQCASGGSYNCYNKEAMFSITKTKMLRRPLLFLSLGYYTFQSQMYT